MSHASTPSFSLDAPVDALWDALRPIAVTLRDVIMSQSSSSSTSMPQADGTASPPPVIPTLQNRRAACTHLTMERLYGDYECMACHRTSSWGWVYICTQDGRDEDVESSRTSFSAGPAWTAELSPWIQNAILDGHYSTEQIDKLVDQRQKVLDTIAASEAHFKKTQPASGRTSLRKSLSAPNTPATATFVDTNPQLPFPLITDFAGSNPTKPRDSVISTASTRSRIFPICRYRACQLCRPTYRDRSWQVFENAFASRITPPSISEGAPDKPTTNASLLKSIGMRTSAKPKRPTLSRKYDTAGVYEADDEQRKTGKRKHGSARRSASARRDREVDVADQRAETDTQGFRNSVKRAFRGMLMTTRKRSSGSSKYSSRKSSRRNGGVEQDPEEFDLGLWKQMSDELLQEAAAVPLPGDESDSEDEWDTDEQVDEIYSNVPVLERKGTGGWACDKHDRDLEAQRRKIWATEQKAGGSRLPGGEGKGIGGIDEASANGHATKGWKIGHGIEEDEAEVGNGVAVTEEAVETGTADIIMQV